MTTNANSKTRRREYHGGFGSGPVIAVKDRGGALVEIIVQVRDATATTARYLIPRGNLTKYFCAEGTATASF